MQNLFQSSYTKPLVDPSAHHDLQESVPFTWAVLALKIPSSHPIFLARATLLLTQQQLCNFKEAKAEKDSSRRKY